MCVIERVVYKQRTSGACPQSSAASRIIRAVSLQLSQQYNTRRELMMNIPFSKETQQYTNIRRRGRQIIAHDTGGLLSKQFEASCKQPPISNHACKHNGAIMSAIMNTFMMSNQMFMLMYFLSQFKCNNISKRCSAFAVIIVV